MITRRPKHGWATLDAVIGITAIAVILTGLIIATGQQRRVGKDMALQRELVRDAELAALDLRLGRETTVEGATVTSIGGGWALLRVERDDRFAELFTPIGGAP